MLAHKQLDHALALHMHQHRRISRQVTDAVRMDDRKFYEDIAYEHGVVAGDEGLSGLWRSLRPILPRQLRKRRHSAVAVGPAPSDLAQHFMGIEAGQECSYAALLQDCHQRQRESQADAPLVIPFKDIPTRDLFERMVLKTKSNRAPGLDQVPAQMIKELLPSFSTEMYALMFKVWLLASEPLQYKGGLLHGIAKRPGRVTTKNLRGIMMLSTMGKVMHATTRQTLLPVAEARRLPTQLGGFCAQQTMFASCWLRSFCQLALAKKLSVATLYVDVRHAFHSLSREVAMGYRDSLPPQLAAHLRREGFNVEHITENIVHASESFRDLTTQALQRVLADQHQGTWFVLTGDRRQECHQTWRGSRPGSPLADIMYNCLMTGLLHDLQEIIQHDEDICQAQNKMGHDVPLITWVDDLAVPMPFLSCELVIPALKRLVPSIRDLFQRYGLQMNFAAGKTEVMLQVRGRGAPAMRRDILCEDFSTSQIQDGVTLRVTTQYTHLGLRYAQSQSIDHEIKGRLQGAEQAYRTLSRTIFQNKRIAVPLRLQLLALVLPILFYGSGSWSLLTPGQFRSIDSKITAWQRRIARRARYADVSAGSDAAFRAAYALPSLSLRLMKHRTLFAFKLFKHGHLTYGACYMIQMLYVLEPGWKLFDMVSDGCVMNPRRTPSKD